MKSFSCIWLGITFLFMALLAFVPYTSAQNTYPVSASINIIPPYSPYLSDYVAPGSDKLVLGLLLNDPNVPLYDVRLQITIEGVGIKIQTHPDFRPSAIHIQSGFQERITTDELQPYFDPGHLVFQGISKEQYQKNAALPDGLYKFCVQAFDLHRNVALSNPACATAWLTLSEPPLLISPSCGSKVSVIYPQNIIFQWQTRNASPNSFSSTEYNFRLVQIMPEGNNANQAMNSMPPVFETTTDQTSLNYGLTETQLVPGQQYAWRVQARDKGGKDLFKNSGFSQVCSFTYGDPCKAPQNIKALSQAPDRVELSWANSPGASKYLVSYHLKGFDSSSDWYQNEALVNRTVLSGLKPGNRYEYKVESVCNAASEESAIDTFSTSALTLNNDCGKAFVIASLDNSSVLSVLNTNDALTVDGFTVRVSEASGGNGIFSGRGVAYIPFLNAYIKMSFNGIGVNEKYQVTSGSIVAEKANLSKYAYVTKAGKNNFCAPVNDVNSVNTIPTGPNLSSSGEKVDNVISDKTEMNDTTKTAINNSVKGPTENNSNDIDLKDTTDRNVSSSSVSSSNNPGPPGTSGNDNGGSKKFKLQNLKVIDLKTKNRIAAYPDTLYLIGTSNRDVQFVASTTDPTKKFEPGQPKWEIKNKNENVSRSGEVSTYTIRDNGYTSGTVSAYDESESLIVKYIDPERKTIQVIPPAINAALTELKDNSEVINNILKQYFKKTLKFDMNMTSSGSQFNKEENASPEYSIRRTGDINFNLVIGTDKQTIYGINYPEENPNLTVRLYWEGNATTKFSGGLEYKKRRKEKTFSLFSKKLSFTSSGAIAVGAEAKFMNVVDAITLSLDGYGKISPEARIEYVNEDENSVNLYLILKPLSIGVKGQAKVKSMNKDYTLFNISYDQEVFERLEIKKTFYLYNESK